MRVKLRNNIMYSSPREYETQTHVLYYTYNNAHRYCCHYIDTGVYIVIRIILSVVELHFLVIICISL